MSATTEQEQKPDPSPAPATQKPKGVCTGAERKALLDSRKK